MADPDIIYQRAVGYWSHVAEDGIVDDDPYPDLVKPSGFVDFVPYLGSSPVLAGGSGFATTVGVVRGIIADGVLQDVQGRNGVYLAAFIDGQPIWWEMKYRHLEFNSDPVPTRDVVFGPTAPGGDLVVTTLVPIGDIDPDDIPSYQSAQQSAQIATAEAARSKEAREGAETARDASAAHATVSGGHADRAMSEADRARGEADRAATQANASASSAAAADGSKAAAATSAGTATTQANRAKTEADRAKSEADRAASVIAEGIGDGTVTPQKLDRAYVERSTDSGKVYSAGAAGAVNMLDATDAATGNALVKRDANGRFSIPAPSAATHPVRNDDGRLSDKRTSPDDTVTTAQLKTDAVTTAKIANGQVTNSKIPAGADIDPTKLGAGRTISRVNGTATSTGIDYVTQAQYDASSKDANTFYAVY